MVAVDYLVTNLWVNSRGAVRAREGTRRFEVVYKEGRHYIRQDREDEEVLRYQPTTEDQNWSVTDYLKKAAEIYGRVNT